MRATYFVHRPRTPRTRFCCCFFFLAFLQRLLNERVHLRLCVHVSGDFFLLASSWHYIHLLLQSQQQKNVHLWAQIEYKWQPTQKKSNIVNSI